MDNFNSAHMEEMFKNRSGKQPLTERSNQCLAYSTSSIETQRNLIAGIGSGAICKVLEYPLDTVKVLLQAHPTQYKGPVDCLRQTYNKNGFIGFYKGVTSPLVGAMLENSALFVSYGFIKNTLEVNSNPTLSNPNPMWKYILSGGFSGVFAAFVLTPIELVKCNMQVQNTGEGIIHNSPREFIRYTLKNDGIQGLWKGNISCLLREVPGNMAWFGVYEYMKTRIIQPTLGIENLNDVPLTYTMIAGGCAGIAYWGIPYPMDTVKSSIQTVKRFNNQSVLNVFLTIYKEQGLKGLYKGSAMTCTRAAFSNAVLFYAYEVIYKYASYYI